MAMTARTAVFAQLHFLARSRIRDPIDGRVLRWLGVCETPFELELLLSIVSGAEIILTIIHDNNNPFSPS
jgi:hypothetical protein